MKKIIIFCEYFGNGGIEKVITYIDKNINKKKYQVKLLCTIYNSQIFNKVISLSKLKTKNYLIRFIITSLNIKRKIYNADIVHINIHSSIGLFYAYLIKNRTKVIVHAHNSNFDNDYFKMKKLINNLFKLLFSSKKYIYVANSEESAKFCFSKKYNYIILDNYLDYSKFIYNKNKRKKIKNKFNIKENEFVIGNIARFAKQKNHIFLIKIFKEFNKMIPNSKLILVGTGKEKKHISKIIKKYNLYDKVILLDYYKEVCDLYQIFDLYLFPSKYEGYGITIMEALASSLICFISKEISSNFPNNPNLINLSIDLNAKEWADMMVKYINYERKSIVINNSNYIDVLEELYEKN